MVKQLIIEFVKIKLKFKMILSSYFERYLFILYT